MAYSPKGGKDERKLLGMEEEYRRDNQYERFDSNAKNSQ